MFVELLDPSRSSEKPQKKSLAIGIDLGTTHTVVACSRNQQAQVLTTSTGARLIPSVVAYTDQTILVGAEAQPHAQAITSIKRLMGAAEISSSLAANYPIVPNEKGIVLEVGKVVKTPVDISADILKFVKITAEETLGEPISEAVITVPAYFDEAARQQTKEAAQLAGLKVLRLINEPTAAALAYGLDQQVEGTYAVYDLGGGTFDISIIRFTKGVFQVVATAGDISLGGDDIDQLLAEKLEVSSLAARDIKEFLSANIAWPDPHFSQDDLAELIAPLISRTLNICAMALADAQVSISDLEGVILVGGSTRMPAIRQAVEQFFEQPPLTNLNPDEVVALGAALQAEALTVGSDTLLLDVTPLSLGIETMGEIVEKIIHRNTPIPVAIAQEFTTYEDGQDAMVIHVVQGEREFVKDCRSLATFTLKNIPPLPAGIARIRITFNLDVDGLLTVSAQEMTTGLLQKVEINPSYGLKDEDLITILRDNYEHGTQDIEERLQVEAILEAEQFLNMLNTALNNDGDLLENEERMVIDEAVTHLQKSLKSRSKDDIKAQLKTVENLTQDFAERRVNRNLRRALSGQRVDAL
ncbi:Hsp70 family protein [Candidatus Odyssella thessalonicensis]|uniref:Hsp70 family protein n=1 Tax=Candidatus Odyssella thessalonicensis TaxID=84647 RepID=UPI000225C1F0|nr:Hsp70 family protein [Candidatus Odyssella thessalonicensis]